MAANFPSSPTIGDTTTIEGIRYEWSGSEWIINTGRIISAVSQSDNGVIDLSKGAWHKVLVDPDNLTVPVSFSNIPGGSSRWFVEFEIDAPTISYDLENASYDNVSFDVSAQDTTPLGIHFKPDGTKMYMVGISSDSVHQYTLTTAWDLSTASYDNVSFDVSAQETSPSGIHFKPDGTRMYMVGYASDSVYQYTLSTAWDISTASYDNVSFSVAAQDTSPRGMHFKPDGTRMYTIGIGSDSVHQYTLSTAWDMSTASYDNVSFSVAAQDTAPSGIHFKPDGTKMYMVGASSDSVHSYTLSTAWDLSTASYDDVSFDVSSQDSPRSIHFKPDGTKMYMVGVISDSVYQYSTGAVFTPTISWGSNIIWEANTPPTITPDQNLFLEFYTPDGGTTIYGIESINKDNTA